MKKKRTQRITISVAARRTGLETKVVRHFVEVGVVSQELTEAELAELRRIRRLTELGVNRAGVEIILRMRRRIEALQAKLAQLEES